MSAHRDITELLGEWLRLTQAEGGAIQSAEWPALRAIQSAKLELQTALDSALSRWSRETGQSPRSPENPFRGTVSHLLSLESRNALLLSAQVSRLLLEKQKSADGLRNLRRLRRSYVHRPETAWESYS